MKKIIFVLLVTVFAVACSKKSTDNDAKLASFGAKISSENAISKDDMAAKYKLLKTGDTINVKFASKINAVCKKKGCWMKLDLGSDEAMVRFKDYGFFMPMNADNKEVIVEGKAFVTEISVSELQHYAKDAGKSAEEIAKITAPEFTYAFEAVGALLKK